MAFAATAGFQLVRGLSGMGLRKGAGQEYLDTVDAEALLPHVASNPTQAAVLGAVNQTTLAQITVSTSARKNFAKRKSIPTAILGGGLCSNASTCHPPLCPVSVSKDLMRVLVKVWRRSFTTRFGTPRPSHPLPQNNQYSHRFHYPSTIY